jgi:hypothetical protein
MTSLHIVFPVCLLTLALVNATAAEPCVKCHSDWSILEKSHPAVSQAKLSDCLLCHQKGKKPFSYQLHVSHSDKTQCSDCHNLTDGQLAVKGTDLKIGQLASSDWEVYQEIFSGFSKSTNTARLHLSLGLGCKDCHSTSTPPEMSTIKNSKCESCHGSIDSIAAKTMPAVKDQNPHKNHQGNINCSKCHSGHGQAKSFCSECHNNFSHKMPESKLAQ